MTKQERLKILLTAGFTYQEIAKEFGVSKARIGQLRKKWFPNMTRSEFGCSKAKLDKLKDKKTSGWRKHREIWQWEDEVFRAKHDYFRRKKENAKKGKWEWEIEFDDIIWHDICPVFGIPISWVNSNRNENSPSLDRIDPTKGYIKGNVELMSWRANRIKNDGTSEEHRQIYEFMLSRSC